MSKQKPEYPTINILRIWDQKHREEEVVCENGRVWRVTDLHEAVKDEPVYQIPLAFIDLAAHKFDSDGGLLAFAMHMRHVQECDADHPIIVDQWGKILDGRHRIVKALLEGRTTIGAKKVPDHTSPTYYK
jgi:hypothetical protein